MRLFRALGLLLLGGSLFVLAVPLGRRAPRPLPARVNGRAEFGAAAEGPLRAGAARVALPSRAPLAGYPNRGTGEGGPLYARALALEAGGVSVALVSIEALLIPGPLEEQVIARAGLPAGACLLLSATHTHSGVGGTWRNPLAEYGGNGHYDEEVTSAVADAAARALTEARQQLAPAVLRWGQTDWSAGPLEARSEGAVDRALTALGLRRPSGEPIATVIDYGMHPTMEPRRTTRLSGDWPGALSAALEREGGVALVLQGASGNATWPRGQGEGELAARIRVAAEGLLQGAGIDSARLGCTVRLVSLPPAAAGAGVPLLLRRGASNLLALFADPYAVRTSISIDALTLLGVPGEPVGALGVAAHAAAGKVAVVGLADGYVGYIEAPGGSGEAARTYHGPDLAQALGLWGQR